MNKEIPTMFKTSRISLPKSKPSSLRLQTKPTKPPAGSVRVGVVDGSPFYLCPADWSLHTVYCGATGSGKTTAMKDPIRQLIDHGAGACIIDPMGPLYDETLAYHCYRKSIGCRVPES